MAVPVDCVGWRGEGGRRFASPASLGWLTRGLFTAAAAMLALASCGAGDEPAVSGATVEETVTCEHLDGYALTYPADWQTYAEDEPDLQLSCGLFGTAPIEVENSSTHLPWIPIRVKVDPIAYESIAGQGFDPDGLFRDLKSRETTVAGRPAVRVLSVSEVPENTLPNVFQLPGGTEKVTWYVDLSTETADRVLIASAIPPAAADTGVTEADKSSEGATSVDSTADVLDAMMTSLTLTD
ncbi:MAG TPA: hypothetical protein GX718_10680 [Brevibacterium sp.]|nr:hypothetical protein [Brevibacterium sp.]